MNLAPVLRIPVMAETSYQVGDPSVIPETPRVAMFFLKIGPEKDEGFYECQAPGCHGCGCPPFCLAEGKIPIEIIEHLSAHAQLCSGMFPAKVQNLDS